MLPAASQPNGKLRPHFSLPQQQHITLRSHNTKGLHCRHHFQLQQNGCILRDLRPENRLTYRTPSLLPSAPCLDRPRILHPQYLQSPHCISIALLMGFHSSPSVLSPPCLSAHGQWLAARSRLSQRHHQSMPLAKTRRTSFSMSRLRMRVDAIQKLRLTTMSTQTIPKGGRQLREEALSGD